MECSCLKCHYYSDSRRTLKLPIKWKSNNWPYGIVTFCNLFRNAENWAKKVLLRQDLICNRVLFQKSRSPCSHTLENNHADWLTKLRKTPEIRAKTWGSSLSKVVVLLGWKKSNRQEQELQVKLGVGLSGHCLRSSPRQVVLCFCINHYDFQTYSTRTLVNKM